MRGDASSDPNLQFVFVRHPMPHREPGADIEPWGSSAWRPERMHGCSVLFSLLRPYSRGSVRVADRAASTAPLIDLGYCTDSRDLDPMLIGLRRARRIDTDAARRAMSGHVRRVYWFPTESWEPCVRHSARLGSASRNSSGDWSATSSSKLTDRGPAPARAPLPRGVVRRRTDPRRNYRRMPAADIPQSLRRTWREGGREVHEFARGTCTRSRSARERASDAEHSANRARFCAVRPAGGTWRLPVRRGHRGAPHQRARQ